MKTEEILLIAALGVGGFLLYKHSQTRTLQAALPVVPAAVYRAPAPSMTTGNTSVNVGQIVDGVGHIVDGAAQIFGRIF
jgi:hypothetical protein